MKRTLINYFIGLGFVLIATWIVLETIGYLAWALEDPTYTRTAVPMFWSFLTWTILFVVWQAGSFVLRRFKIDRVHFIVVFLGSCFMAYLSLQVSQYVMCQWVLTDASYVDILKGFGRHMSLGIVVLYGLVNFVVRKGPLRFM